MFKVDSENLRRWKLWRNITWIDIVGVLTLGTFLGMYLYTASSSTHTGWIKTTYMENSSLSGGVLL
ncbi:MAG: hypothetical protein QXZ41_03075 [Ignisphaera sp.]|uniref:Uncharacterized protein n=1 Tax=Ignisphaera aggregans TaxID=334771 RepID=A0A832CT81_9CREN